MLPHNSYLKKKMVIFLLSLHENICCGTQGYPGSEFVAANTLTKWKKLEPNEINFSQGFSQKVVSTSCFVFKYLPARVTCYLLIIF